jgi:hypothetical protein
MFTPPMRRGAFIEPQQPDGMTNALCNLRDCAPSICGLAHTLFFFPSELGTRESRFALFRLRTIAKPVRFVTKTLSATN